MELVAAHADWWNVHIGILDKLDEMRPRPGAPGCSLQVQIAFVALRGPARGDRRRRRPAPLRQEDPCVGTRPELVDYFGSLAERGVERVYVWFSDFAPAETLAAFGAAVIGATRTPRP